MTLSSLYAGMTIDTAGGCAASCKASSEDLSGDIPTNLAPTEFFLPGAGQRPGYELVNSGTKKGGIPPPGGIPPSTARLTALGASCLGAGVLVRHRCSGLRAMFRTAVFASVATLAAASLMSSAASLAACLAVSAASSVDSARSPEASAAASAAATVAEPAWPAVSLTESLTSLTVVAGTGRASRAPGSSRDPRPAWKPSRRRHRRHGRGDDAEDQPPAVLGFCGLASLDVDGLAGLVRSRP